MNYEYPLGYANHFCDSSSMSPVLCSVYIILFDFKNKTLEF